LITAAPVGAGSQPSLDIVIPVYNEAEVLDLLFEALDSTFSLAALAERGLSEVRYILVDDGSSDDSARIISEKIRGGARAVMIRLSRNFGHASAISAGLDHSSADLVALIDADLQDPPAVVLDMVERARAGYDIVFGQRRNRKEGVLKRLGYWSFYRVIAALSDIDIPLDSGDFCLLTRRVVAAMHDLPERLRYPRVLRAWVGFPQAGVEYERPRRQAGNTKYTVGRLYRLATDGIAAASIRPLKVAQLSSFLFGGMAAVLTLVFGLALAGGIQITVSHPILLASLLIAASNTLIMLVLYVLSAYIGRMYLEVKGRPPYMVMERVERQHAVLADHHHEGMTRRCER
jgi:glycosyltransferase involved in cell wall biosynthesis